MNGIALLSVRRGRRLLQCRTGWREFTTAEVARSTVTGNSLRVWNCSHSAAGRESLRGTDWIYPEQSSSGPLVGLVGRGAEYHVNDGRSDAREKDGFDVFHRHNGDLLPYLRGRARSLGLGRI